MTSNKKFIFKFHQHNNNNNNNKNQKKKKKSLVYCINDKKIKNKNNHLEAIP